MSVIRLMTFLDKKWKRKGAVCMSCFELVCGYEDIKAELIRIHNVLKNAEKFKKLGVKRPRGVLLYGDPGLGKTRMAECFIGEWTFPTFEISKEEQGCEVIAEIRAAFAKAKEAGKQAIVFLDNLDDDADANVYAALRACMDAYREDDVFVLATAKDIENIPDYLLRPGRFDKVIEVAPPHRRRCNRNFKLLSCAERMRIGRGCGGNCRDYAREFLRRFENVGE